MTTLCEVDFFNFLWLIWMHYLLVATDGNRTVPSREVPGRSRDVTGLDLETLKVPWSCGPGTKEVQKVPGLENWKIPRTMETLVGT